MSFSGGVTLPALHRVCRDGDGTALSALIDKSGTDDRLELFHRMCEYDSFLGWTPAHWASYHGKTECFRQLLSCGLNVDVGDGRYKRTPAHIAAFAGHPHMLLWILQAGADPNKQDDNGDTLVHHAARSGSNDCLNILHSHNCYMCLSNKVGQTPMDVAILCGFEHCAQYLSQFQSHGYHSAGQRNLKRRLDEDDINQEVKRVCNGFAWPKQSNGVIQENHKLDMETQFKVNNHTMQLESQLNGHTGHEMEIQYNNTDQAITVSPTKQDHFTCNSTTKLYKLSTKLSMPQRCMGSHYM